MTEQPWSLTGSEIQHPRLLKNWRYFAGRVLPLSRGQELQRWTDEDYWASCRCRSFLSFILCIVLLLCDKVHTPVFDKLCLLPTLILAHFWAKPLPPLWLSVYLPYHQYYNIWLGGSITPCRKEEKSTSRLDFVQAELDSGGYGARSWQNN